MSSNYGTDLISESLSSASHQANCVNGNGSLCRQFPEHFLSGRTRKLIRYTSSGRLTDLTQVGISCSVTVSVKDDDDESLKPSLKPSRSQKPRKIAGRLKPFNIDLTHGDSCGNASDSSQTIPD